MNTFQLWYALCTNEVTGKNFSGVFARDTLPPSLSVGDVIVCNTDVSHGPGKHWVAWYRTSENEYEFFDSLGKQPDDYWDFPPFSYKRVTFMPVRIQSRDTNICGEMCLFYVLAALRGTKITDISFIMPFEQTLREIVSHSFIIPSRTVNVNMQFNQDCTYN